MAIIINSLIVAAQERDKQLQRKMNAEKNEMIKQIIQGEIDDLKEKTQEYQKALQQKPK